MTSMTGDLGLKHAHYYVTLMCYNSASGANNLPISSHLVFFVHPKYGNKSIIPVGNNTLSENKNAS